MKNLKILVLIFGIAILCTGCQNSEKYFLNKKIFATVENSNKYFLGQVGHMYGKARNNKIVLSLSYPDVSDDISGYELMYDGKRLTGKFILVGSYTIHVYERLYYSNIDIVPVVTPVYMRTENFNYLYRTDKKYLIDFLNSIKVTHNLQ